MVRGTVRRRVDHPSTVDQAMRTYPELFLSKKSFLGLRGWTDA